MGTGLVQLLKEKTGFRNLLDPTGWIPRHLYGIELFFLENGLPLPSDGVCNGPTLDKLLENVRTEQDLHKPELIIVGGIYKAGSDYPEQHQISVYIGFDVSQGIKETGTYLGYFFGMPNERLKEILSMEKRLIDSLNRVGYPTDYTMQRIGLHHIELKDLGDHSPKK